MAKKEDHNVINHDDEEEPETLELHYRVTLDFRLLARPLTAEVWRESYYWNEAAERETEESHFLEKLTRQRRLYKLLRENQPLLEDYLLSVLTQEAGNLVYEALPAAFDVKEEAEILTPLYKKMGLEDVEFFEDCRKRNVLEDNTDFIEAAFKVEWLGAEVQEMTRRLSGDVKIAKVVEKTKVRIISKLTAMHRSVG